MARKSDDLADSFTTDESGGWLTRLLADEEQLDNRTKWRLGAWTLGSLGALVVAILASQNAGDRKREQIAAADLTRQTQMIQRLAKDSQSETSRLAAAIESLNGDRDRMFSRLGTLEQELDSVTGSIARVQAAASPPPATTAKPSAKPAAQASLPEIPVKETAAASPAIAATEPRPSATPAAAAPHAKPAPAAESSPASAVPTLVPVAAPLTPPSTPPLAAPPAAAASAEATPPQVAKPVQAAPSPAATPAAAAVTAAVVPEVEPRKVTADRVPAEKPPASKPIAETAAGEKPLAALITTTPLMPPRSILAPPDPGAARLLESKASPPVQDSEDDADKADDAPVPVRRTEFGVDLGGANSLEGLRSMWRRLSQAQTALKGLQPVVMVKERVGGTQLRLVAGPLSDAAAAAKICAALGSADRVCETSVYDGQRLPAATAAPAAQSAPTAPPPRRHRARVTTPPEPPPLPPPQPHPQSAAEPAPGPSSLTSMFGIR